MLQSTGAKIRGRSNTCECLTKFSTWSRINSRTSHRAVVEVAVSKGAIMEEEETEEGVGQEEREDEAEAEVESVHCAPTQIFAPSNRDHGR